ncbi:MAG: DUF362 domain-containing protein [Proteobacteria bacterium]|nr:DUF362 domain-containing protein [Pseudomonadota bacterium]
MKRKPSSDQLFNPSQSVKSIDKSKDRSISRREFIAMVSAAVAGGLILDSCSGESGSAPGPAARPEAFLGLYSPGSSAGPEDAVRQLCEKLDFSWLKSGDSVFLKPACNSGNPHPATTSPNAVRAVIAELKARGAGRIIVGDQAGMEWVRLSPTERRTGSTRDLMAGNGLLDAITSAGAEPHFFDEHTFANGYFESTLDLPSRNWEPPPYLPNIIKEVDHIIYLPRLSSHLIAGYTFGHKCAIGWLRDDSRYQCHFEGSRFHEKYVEINYAKEIRDRHRLTITLAEKLLLDSGPDSGTIANAEPWILIASGNLAAHDAVGVAALSYIDALTSPASILPGYGKSADILNQALITGLVPGKSGEPWGDRPMSDYTDVKYHDYQKGIASDLALTRAYGILGGVPAHTTVRLEGEPPSEDFRNFLESWSNGFFRLI